MTAFSVKFVNKTQTVWTMVVTITLPGGNGLQSVAFQQVRAPGNNGSGTVRFDDQLCVCLGSHSGTGSSRVYETTLTNPAARPLVVMNSPITDVYGSHWSVSGREVPDERSADDAVYLPGRNLLLLSMPSVGLPPEASINNEFRGMVTSGDHA